MGSLDGDFEEALYKQHKAWEEEQEYYASKEAEAMADIEAERAMAIYCDDCQQDRDLCPDCCNGDKYVSPDIDAREINILLPCLA